MTKHGAFVLAWLALASPGRAQAAAPPKDVHLDGYAEWREGDLLIVDGQRVRMAEGGHFKGEGEAASFTTVPLGYEVRARGRRLSGGLVAARELEAKPNGSALFEKQVRSLTDEAEAEYRRAGSFFQRRSGRIKVVGRLRDSGADVDRVRATVERLAPPYLDPASVRVYVIDNKEWNAFAMGNYAVYVFSGLLRDLDDDELAIVLGHEIAHATHEHTRRQFKKQMWIQIAALGASAAAGEIDGRNKRALANLLAAFTVLAWSNGYGRDLEDQADRVGLRYAYEGGYGVTRGPELWQRFARRYGEPRRLVNFFFGDHSRASARALRLRRELALNYPQGARQGISTARSTTPRPAPAPPPGPANLAHASRPPASALADDSPHGTPTVEIKPGMSFDEVRRLLGPPRAEVIFGRRVRWTYPECTVVFEDGRVTEVRF